MKDKTNVGNISMKVAWYRSLPFKLFVFMTFFLAAAVLSISWQNGRTFRNLLEKQSEESTITLARRTAASLGSGFAFWNSTVHSVMHAAASVNSESEKKFIESLVFSSRNIVAFQSFDVNKNNTTAERAFAFTQDTLSPNWRGKYPGRAKIEIQKIGSNFASKNSPQGKGIVSVANLFPELALPITQIRIPFVTQRGAIKTKSWAVLSFWTSNLSTSLTTTDMITSVVTNPEGSILFDAKGTTSDELRAPIKPDFFDGLINSPVGFRTSKSEANDGSPVLSIAIKIPEVPLFVRLQKTTTAEAQQVSFQIRKILLWSLILFLLTLLASFMVADGLTHRLQEVILATTRIASGDFQSRISMKSRDEVGFLAYAVNSMAKAIEDLLQVRDKAIRQDMELKTAEAIQKTLVPQLPGTQNHINSYGFFRAATECAGDWWGRFDLDEGKSLIAIADATGHGASSAIIASLAYAFFATLQTNHIEKKVSSKIDLVETLKQLNSILWSSGQGACTMTMFVVLSDSRNGTIQVASAAHTFPFLVEAGEKIKAIGCGGSILGTSPEVEFVQEELPMKAGNRLFLFTDGLVENLNSEGKPTGRKAIRNMLSKLESLNGEEFFSAAKSHIDEHFSGTALDDDVTVVIVEVDPSWSKGAT
jgi:serine phosphatase RsbU (regulator of sigma subunit)